MQHYQQISHPMIQAVHRCREDPPWSRRMAGAGFAFAWRVSHRWDNRLAPHGCCFSSRAARAQAFRQAGYNTRTRPGVRCDSAEATKVTRATYGCDRPRLRCDHEPSSIIRGLSNLPALLNPQRSRSEDRPRDARASGGENRRPERARAGLLPSRRGRQGARNGRERLPSRAWRLLTTSWTVSRCSVVICVFAALGARRTPRRLFAESRG